MRAVPAAALAVAAAMCGLAEGGVTSPAGGETWAAGTVRDVAWSLSGPAEVNLDLWLGGMPCAAIAASAPNDGYYSWSIPQNICDVVFATYRVRVSDAAAPATFVESAEFTIEPGPDAYEDDDSFAQTSSIALTEAQERSLYPLGDKDFVAFELAANAYIEAVAVPGSGKKLQLRVYDAADASTLLGSDSNLADAEVSVPLSLQAGSYVIEVVYLDAPEPTYRLELRTRSIVVTAPRAGAQWPAGEGGVVAWSHYAAGASVSVELLLGGAVVRMLSPSTPNDGAFDCFMPLAEVAGADYAVRVTSTTIRTDPFDPDSAFVSGESGEFTIPAHVAVTAPNGGEEWGRGESGAVTWQSNAPSLRIELLKGGAVVELIAASAANDGRHGWPVPDDLALGDDYAVRISSASGPAASDESDAAFSVVEGDGGGITCSRGPGRGAHGGRGGWSILLVLSASIWALLRRTART